MTPADRKNPQGPRLTTGTKNATAVQSEPGKGASKDEIEADLMRTRRELGETVGALAEKLDVKSQAREQINVTKDRIAEQSSEARQHAARFIGRVKASLSDGQGRPNTNAWIGAGALAVTAALLLASRARR
ncbi:DUF3618 domain-containing protein [Nesterenkonia sp. AN1]|uniref:DUF3618 domain-containing protein n=1 Tax=Nesterenkonia sp. AN1 TaxID=652017 RepID=UPI000684D2E6|nr:DUF3618 domain-containing protein [Nesterenkonia sp. AN1]